MFLEQVVTKPDPYAPFLLSQAIRANGFVFVSGQAAIIPSPVFTGTSLKGLDFANRLAVAPMTRISASSAGVPGERMVQYYKRFARGGFSLVTTEGLYTDKAYAQT